MTKELEMMTPAKARPPASGAIWRQIPSA